ncbi:MAG: hypothetical protein C0458_21765 [Methylobacterium sp.]|nr:hypothetical protein [Methylobacterium sp.]
MSTNAVNKTLEIVESTYGPTPCGKGMQLRCLTQEVGGAFEGRLAHLDFILEHADKHVQEHGQRSFAALRRATGVLNPEDSSELHFKAFRIASGALAAA